MRLALGECLLEKGEHAKAGVLLRQRLGDFLRDIPDSPYYPTKACDSFVELGEKTTDTALVREYGRFRDS